MADKACGAIRHAIVTLEFKPGQFIYETQIANMLGVSRTPIREAFKQLESRGMVEIHPQKGILITPISMKKVEEVRFIRKSLEVNAFCQVAREWNKSSSRCKQLQFEVMQTLKSKEEAIKKNDYYLFLKYDDEYHFNILSYTNNKTLIDVISQMKDHLNRVRYLELMEPRHMEDVLNEHRNIFQAITENDEKKAAALLTEHLDSFQFKEEHLQKYKEYVVFDK